MSPAANRKYLPRKKKVGSKAIRGIRKALDLRATAHPNRKIFNRAKGKNSSPGSVRNHALAGLTNAER